MVPHIRIGKTGFPTLLIFSGFTILSIVLSACSPISVSASSISNPTPTLSENTFSPFITVLDQVIVNNSVTVQEVYSDGPGWLVIFADGGGRPGLILGHSAVKNGDNQDVNIPINPAKTTTILYSLLLSDQGKPGDFEFPGPDKVVVSNNDIILKSFVILKPLSNTVPALQVSDQSLIGGRIILSSVISQGPGWVVIYAQKNGQPGAVLGRTPVKDGENEDVIVEVNPAKAIGTLYAQLFIDQGKIGTFENPGVDNPEMVGGQPVSAEFKIIKPGAGNSLIITMKKDPNLGIYLVDGKGLTLYQQRKDQPLKMICYPGCLEAWPPVTSNSIPQVSGGVNSSRLGLMTLPNGAKVVTYNSLPLYYYKLDTQPGDMIGRGIGGDWHLVVP
ncbi:MAG: hypothetical protein P4L50_17060 [Anaerolineaceae bacterium]|nr:hypothetical protein [Anaerolineaceae bacterium]